VRPSVVVFIYGSGWKDGDKRLHRFAGAALASRGFLAVVPDYRVFSSVWFVCFILLRPSGKTTGTDRRTTSLWHRP
jgi:hypothetical protein